MNLSRCFVAIATPFDDRDRLDIDSLQRHARWMVDEGVSGIVVCGTTGESATLRDDEKIDAMNAVFDAVGDRATVIGGVGNNCTAESLVFLDTVNERVNVHGIMAVVPYYNRPNQRGLKEHFTAIADASRFDVILYNVPSRTVVELELPTVIELAEHPRIIGLKEASGKLSMAAQLRARLPSDFALLSGDDKTAMAFIAVGGDGVISVAGNVAPREMSLMCAAVAKGDLATARTLNARIVDLDELLFRYASPLPTKAILEAQGRCRAATRLPLSDLLPDERDEVVSGARALGFVR